MISGKLWYLFLYSVGLKWRKLTKIQAEGIECIYVEFNDNTPTVLVLKNCLLYGVEVADKWKLQQQASIMENYFLL